jgi:hypothetical protein
VHVACTEVLTHAHSGCGWRRWQLAGRRARTGFLLATQTNVKWPSKKFKVAEQKNARWTSKKGKMAEQKKCKVDEQKKAKRPSKKCKGGGQKI